MSGLGGLGGASKKPPEHRFVVAAVVPLPDPFVDPPEVEGLRELLRVIDLPDARALLQRMASCLDLVDIGFSSDVTHAVTLLSRSYGSDYDAYKRALLDAPGEAGRLARKVKLADARENLARCEAAHGVPKWQRLGDKRYRPLIAALEGIGDRRRG